MCIRDRDKQKEETYGLLKKYSVVVVDNTGDLRNYLKEFLEGYFNQIYVSKDGKDALRLIKERLPDLIVTDVKMCIRDSISLHLLITHHLAAARLIWLTLFVGEIELHKPVVVELLSHRL